MSLKLVLVALLVDTFLPGVSGVRYRRRTGATPGEVHALYTFGAPATAIEPLTNHRSSSGCFPGYRAWNEEDKLISSTIDIVVPLAGVAGFHHPKQAGLQLNVHDGSYNGHACSDKVAKMPNGWKRKRISLHSTNLYVDLASKINKRWYNVSKVGLQLSYERDPAEAARRGAKYGWKLMFSANQDGEGTQGGYQVSHLFQQQDSSECILTFQGSQDLGDWTANIDFRRASFCGFSQEVHKGFRDHLLRITGSPIWQEKIKPFLPGCSKVNVVGHSLGGATSELFTACVQRAPKAGEAGYEHYQIMGWNADNTRVSTKSGKGSAKRSGKGAKSR